MIKIICVGKIKERYWSAAIEEYLKRLSKYTKIQIIEIEDDGNDDMDRSLNNEKEKILKKIKQQDYIITSEIDGIMYDSISFSEKIEELFVAGNSDITFIIGGSYGLHSDVKEKANLKLSFSKMTFPHQLFRVILLEQIYRSFRIINNEKYHK
ncbi:MAG: 23S rRNA (pseudouridine(1915)-N(3))-methyltransferase RlmH [Bacilli bacterium]|nr:23S rRNA (pseudouridine(1915)-N(3))-methyltransferase RlmH [Bacilli bacterium]MDD3304979.1 23S rRNA (pseudouridine(1915)-N(3))-methyltransferase RlmH [Bacilli bacterium]MDD4053859.1 23S rRNA (pseudouridine(1915)-N(3))-methyltransferase RlmH [Bacilli bacterium]MDD4411051.1 23S rRNA (pseudouridine(1915)-N(3))-methyltransferase RlmH [Bacilli bacterium]